MGEYTLHNFKCNRFVLWFTIWFILENVPYALDKKGYPAATG